MGTRLRWVCVSDLHLGALNSVLTAVATDGTHVERGSPPPAMIALAACIRALHAGQDELPELVVLGDLFELALVSTDAAAATFGQFVASLRIGEPDASVAPLIRFVPGNHDHRLWTAARSAHYLEQLRQVSGDDAALPEARHATELLPEHQRLAVRDEFVELLATRVVTGVPITVEQNYPNLGIVTPDGRKAVVLSHGHFVEPLYRLMSNLDLAFALQRPEDLPRAWQLEADNGSWIDFFWSSMGDSGDVTGIVRNLYESMQSAEAMEAEILAIKRFIAKRHPGPRGVLEAWLASTALRTEGVSRLHRERHRPDTTLSPAAERGLAQFVAGPVRSQLSPAEPDHMTFVFGHTHKPFVDSRTIEGFVNPVSIVNTGGWVVDSVDSDPRKGASLIAVDWDANVAVVRCYTQQDDEAAFRITVTSGDANQDNPLVAELGALIDPARDPWLSLGQSLSAAVNDRSRELRERLAATVASAARERR